MSRSVGDRQLLGAGAAACAVCCAAPVLTLIGVGGAAATVATAIFAGLVFGAVVAAGAIVAIWNQRRSRRGDACAPVAGPTYVDVGAPSAPERETRP